MGLNGIIILICINIIMNDSASIRLATSYLVFGCLALGGLVGMYMFKPTDDTDKDNEYDVEDSEDTEYNEDSLFGPGGIFNWGSSSTEENKEDDNIEVIDEDDYKPRKKGSKTLKNRKPTGSSRRRY